MLITRVLRALTWTAAITAIGSAAAVTASFILLDSSGGATFAETLPAYESAPHMSGEPIFGILAITSVVALVLWVIAGALARSQAERRPPGRRREW